MPEPVACFLLEPAGVVRQGALATCRCGHEHPIDLGEHERYDVSPRSPRFEDVEWPRTCASCGRAINYEEAGTRRSTHATSLYRRDTGELGAIRDFGPGAMWDARWMRATGRTRWSPDGLTLCVRLPNGSDWVIDSQASNCTMPGEDHDCWCRHGNAPKITVDKVPEPGRSTCAAGAGSILIGDWHGFLRDGFLVAC